MSNRTHVEEFSRVELRNGDVRTIVVLSRPGDRPALAVSFFRRCALVTRICFHQGPLLDALSAAVHYARQPDLYGRVDAGEVPLGDDLRVAVWARADGVRPPVVAFGRKTATGKELGRATVIAGVELDALEQALRNVHERITAARAARRRTA